MFHFKQGRHGFEGHFGPGWHGRGRRFGGRGGGRGRGEIKYEILECLVQGPRHGYDIMLEIEAKSGMRPSPGSIYPALQMLEDGDFIRGTERDGKRTYEITDKGRELLAQREKPEEEDFGGETIYGVIADAMRQVHGIKDAVKQIARSGNIELYKKALAVLDRARRELFALLAEHF
jgi:DNA-binding PadR family transcriptional regulator